MHRLLIIYLVAYYALIAGAVLTVWRSGLVSDLGRNGTVLGITVAVALGALLAALSRK
jgi:hypothetical protein